MYRCSLAITIRSIVDQLPKATGAPQDDDLFDAEGVTQTQEHVDRDHTRAIDHEAQDTDQLGRDILWNAEADGDRPATEDATGTLDPDASLREVVQQPIFNAAFARKIGPNLYKPFAADEVARDAKERAQYSAEHPREEMEMPSSQQATAMMARPKPGEGDRGHKIKESRNKLSVMVSIGSLL